jgi:hypothetical protein
MVPLYKSFTNAAAIGMAVMCLESPAFAQTPCEEAELFDAEGGLSDLFGHAVAIDGDTAVVGAVYDDDNAWHAGAAYVFRNDAGTTSWVQQQKLLPDDGVANYDFFGYAVAVVGDTVVIGVPRDDDNGEDSGSAYVFRFDGSSWTQAQKILPADGAAGDEFGNSVALEGNTLVIGARFDDDNGYNSGSAYVFRDQGSGWVQVQELLATDEDTEEERFGRSVAIDNGTVVVGSIDYNNGDHASSAFVFRFNAATSQWNQEQKLGTPSGSGTVAISGDRILMGEANDDQNGPATGAAYIFRFDGSSWSQEQKLLASDGAPFNAFGGYGVALAGDTAVIAAPGHDHGCPNPEVYGNCDPVGAAYVYRFDGLVWVQVAELLPAPRSNPSGENFGRSAAISGDTLLIGATYALGNGQWSGSTYVFDLDPALGDLDCDGAVGVTDFFALLAAWGPCAECGICPADLDRDCAVTAVDFFMLLANWG